MAEVKELAEQLVNLTVKEVQELSDFLKNEYGIEPASAAVAVSAAATTEASDQQESVQSEFEVILTAAGQAKLKVVKLVKELTGTNLKEAKGLVDSAPSPIKSGISREEADSLLKALTEAGAEAEIK
ncbi:MAG: 50S ribosomal protein L7/L12 [Flavobacteriaceae bacterium]|nr:50S ribosomal protein L7/L12 [Flavobacteriaceae bacterium]MCY4215623.1 50S ribosomal protein L7/L12 [Flavobacteriaceae bacterium]MCY4254455.1 50S ribosomal protein L7/L12 [Flavobacteriaceae bacterium]